MVIFTDGGASPNPGRGGWAAILRSGRVELEVAGADPRTTNNRMELTAAIQGLRQLDRPSRVTVVTDSSYVHRGMTEWISGWSRAGFRRGRKPLPNAELWKELAREALRHQTAWAWTRGHAGDALNERCDALVAAMRERATAGRKPAELHRVRRTVEQEPPAIEGTPSAEVWI